MSKYSVSRNTKVKILQKANELFAKRGYDGVSIQKIALAVGLKKSSVLFHYRNKETLACEAIRLLTEFVFNEIGQSGLTHLQFAKSIVVTLKKHTELSAPIYLAIADSPMIQSVAQSYFDSWMSVLKKINGEDWAVKALSTLLGGCFLYNLYDDEKALKVLAQALKPGAL